MEYGTPKDAYETDIDGEESLVEETHPTFIDRFKEFFESFAEKKDEEIDNEDDEKLTKKKKKSFAHRLFSKIPGVVVKEEHSVISRSGAEKQNPSLETDTLENPRRIITSEQIVSLDNNEFSDVQIDELVDTTEGLIEIEEDTVYESQDSNYHDTFVTNIDVNLTTSEIGRRNDYQPEESIVRRQTESNPTIDTLISSPINEAHNYNIRLNTPNIQVTDNGPTSLKEQPIHPWEKEKNEQTANKLKEKKQELNKEERELEKQRHQLEQDIQKVYENFAGINPPNHSVQEKKPLRPKKPLSKMSKPSAPKPIKEQYVPKQYESIQPSEVSMNTQNAMERPPFSYRSIEQDRRHEIKDEPKIALVKYGQNNDKSAWQKSLNPKINDSATTSPHKKFPSAKLVTPKKPASAMHQAYTNAAITGFITGVVLLGIILAATIIS